MFQHHSYELLLLSRQLKGTVSGVQGSESKSPVNFLHRQWYVTSRSTKASMQTLQVNYQLKKKNYIRKCLIL